MKKRFEHCLQINLKLVSIVHDYSKKDLAFKSYKFGVFKMRTSVLIKIKMVNFQTDAHVQHKSFGSSISMRMLRCQVFSGSLRYTCQFAVHSVLSPILSVVC